MLDYRHLLKMTDSTGMLQFSKLHTPDPASGHTLDDNARALIAALFMEEGQELSMKYASFIDSCQQSDGSWSNLRLNGRYTSLIDSEDSIGRTLLACSLASTSEWDNVNTLCSRIFKDNLPRVINFTSPRAIAYTLLALAKGQTIKKVPMMNTMAEYLLSLYKSKKSTSWYWFEDYLTYCNGVLPHSLLAVYEINGDKRFLKAGLDSLNFLNSILFREGYLNIIGNQGWYQKGGTIPLFDQQPVDAASIIFALFEAHTITGKSEYLELSRLAHRWYRGANIHGAVLYNHETGGCYDALTETGVNLNQGAEAVLSLITGVNLNQGAEAVLSLILSDMLMEGVIQKKFLAARTS